MNIGSRTCKIYDIFFLNFDVLGSFGNYQCRVYFSNEPFNKNSVMKLHLPTNFGEDQMYNLGKIWYLTKFDDFFLVIYQNRGSKWQNQVWEHGFWKLAPFNYKIKLITAILTQLKDQIKDPGKLTFSPNFMILGSFSHEEQLFSKIWSFTQNFGLNLYLPTKFGEYRITDLG